MKINRCKLNEKGLTEVQACLAANHTLAGDRVSREMLNAWARDAEFHLRECSMTPIEIQFCYSVSGHTENYVISADGLDCEEIDVEE